MEDTRFLYVFVVLRHDRRHIVHFRVTTSPCAGWIALLAIPPPSEYGCMN